jgi:hypothetical protein
MRKINRKDFFKEMSEKEMVVSYDTGEKVYLQDLIMSFYTSMKIDSFNKNSKYGVRFVDGDPLNCKEENLELVELIDNYLN